MIYAAGRVANRFYMVAIDIFDSSIHRKVFLPLIDVILVSQAILMRHIGWMNERAITTSSHGASRSHIYDSRSLR